MKDYIIIEKGPTQIEIANACGCSRETVSRMMTSLVKKGILECPQKTIYPLSGNANILMEKDGNHEKNSAYRTCPGKFYSR